MKLNYLIQLPEAYAESDGAWPLLLFLHGMGERGNDLEQVKLHGPPKMVAEGKRFSFVLVSPQCPENGWWATDLQLRRLDALLDEVVSRYRVDEDRTYVTGMSMGGFGTWALAIRHPHRFAAIAPVCGGGNPGVAARIKHLPVWAFHGAKDERVPLQKSQEMVDALRAVGGDVTFTVYPDAAHDSWTQTYSNPELYAWFLQHRRRPIE